MGTAVYINNLENLTNIFCGLGLEGELALGYAHLMTSVTHFSIYFGLVFICGSIYHQFYVFNCKQQII